MKGLLHVYEKWVQAKSLKGYFLLLYSKKDKNINMNKKQESHLYVKVWNKCKEIIPENVC